MIVERNIYLKKLIVKRHNGKIKIVTGIRRCGKSFLLSTLYASWLKDQGVDDDHVILQRVLAGRTQPHSTFLELSYPELALRFF